MAKVLQKVLQKVQGEQIDKNLKFTEESKSNVNILTKLCYLHICNFIWKFIRLTRFMLSVSFISDFYGSEDHLFVTLTKNNNISLFL